MSLRRRPENRPAAHLERLVAIACLVLLPPAVHAQSRADHAPASNPAVCAKTYAQAAKASPCGRSFSGACTYPEGHCTCERVEPCSGVPPSPPDLSQELHEAPLTYRWTCEPRVRPDGCPGIQPTQGSRCTHEGRRCSYGTCCVQTMACQGGGWRMSMVQCPP